MFFTNRGRVYQMWCYEIPEAGRTARGTAIVNLLQLDAGEKVTSMLAVPEDKASGYLVMATKCGVIKRTQLSEFVNLRKAGLIAIVLREDDELISVALTDGSRELILGSRGGMSIRFSENDMRPMGRNATGVKSMELDDGDEVVAMAVVEDDCEVLAITANGFGKRTAIDEYRSQTRGGKGIKAMQLTDKSGQLAGQLLVHEDEDILMITDDGTIIRTPASSIPIHGRATKGVRMMRVADGCRIMSIERAQREPDEPETAAEEPELDINAALNDVDGGNGDI